MELTSGNNNRVVSLSVGGLDVSFQSESNLRIRRAISLSIPLFLLFPLSSLSKQNQTYSQLNTGLPFTITVDLHNLDLVLAIAGFLEVNLAGAHICVVYREGVSIKKKEKIGNFAGLVGFLTSGAIIYTCIGDCQ